MNCPKCGTKMKVVRSVLDIPNGIRYRQYRCPKCPLSYLATTEAVTDYYRTMDDLYALHYEHQKERVKAKTADKALANRIAFCGVAKGGL